MKNLLGQPHIAVFLAESTYQVNSVLWLGTEADV